MEKSIACACCNDPAILITVQGRIWPGPYEVCGDCAKYYVEPIQNLIQACAALGFTRDNVYDYLGQEQFTILTMSVIRARVQPVWFWYWVQRKSTGPGSGPRCSVCAESGPTITTSSLIMPGSFDRCGPCTEALADPPEIVAGILADMGATEQNLSGAFNEDGQSVVVASYTRGKITKEAFWAMVAKIGKEMGIHPVKWDV